MNEDASRRDFLRNMAVGAGALGYAAAAGAEAPKIQGFEEAPVDPAAAQGWQPVSGRRLRLGIVGYGYCRFGAAFSFQDHPSVEVVDEAGPVAVAVESVNVHAGYRALHFFKC